MLAGGGGEVEAGGAEPPGSSFNHWVGYDLRKRNVMRLEWKNEGMSGDDDEINL